MCKKMGTRWNIVGPDHNGSASGAPSWTRVIEGSTGHRVRGWGVDKKRVNRNGRTAKWFLTSFGKFWRKVMDFLGTHYFSSLCTSSSFRLNWYTFALRCFNHVGQFKSIVTVVHPRILFLNAYETPHVLYCTVWMCLDFFVLFFSGPSCGSKMAKSCESLF